MHAIGLGRAEIRLRETVITPASDRLFALAFQLCLRADEHIARDDLVGLFWADAPPTKGLLAVKAGFLRLDLEDDVTSCNVAISAFASRSGNTELAITSTVGSLGCERGIVTKLPGFGGAGMRGRAFRSSNQWRRTLNRVTGAGQPSRTLSFTAGANAYPWYSSGT